MLCDIMQNKNTAMIVSWTKIYCPSELQQKRTHTVYRNVTEYNKKNTAMIVSLTKIFVIIILSDVLIDSERSFLLKVR
jgi:hypothetical protein